MKTIIVPIDFSDASKNALLFAAEISKRASLPLVVVNILGKGDDETKATAKLKTTISDLKKSFGADLKCESTVVRGSLVTALKKEIKARQSNLVVMGTKGATGLKRILIGSNTVDLIAKTKAPVLVIPKAAKFENFLKSGKNRVVLATDLNSLKNPDALDILKKIALLIIEPKIRVLNIRPKNTRLNYLTHMERNALLSVFNPEIAAEPATVFSNNVMSGIKYYLDKNKDTGLVSMIARDTGDLIQKHFTREMASHSRYPLLVLHDA
jgi:nucleotide-binding universal stress UspA family protein